MAEADTQGALFEAAKTFLNAEGIVDADIAFPNWDFNPAGKPVWANLNLVPSDIKTIETGEGGLDREIGFMQIDINIPRNKGDATLRTFKTSSRAFFPAGKSFTKNGQAVSITKVTYTPARPLDNWFRMSITIFYRTDYQRANLT